MTKKKSKTDTKQKHGNKADGKKKNSKLISGKKNSQPKKSKRKKHSEPEIAATPVAVTPVMESNIEAQPKLDDIRVDTMVGVADETVASDRGLVTQPLLPDAANTVPDAWALDDDNHALIFEMRGERLTTVPLSPAFLEQLLPQLNAMYIASSEAATEWQIRVPDDINLPPVLSLVRGDAVAASLSLTEETLAELDGALRTYYVRPEEKRVSPWLRLRAWYKRHRIVGTGLMILLVPVAGFFLYSVGVQLFTLK